jgi:predicted transcriptional regulator YdeE
MKVMVIIRSTTSSEAGELPDTALLTAMGKYCDELAEAGILLAGEGLHPSSKGVRVQFSAADRTVIDGPFTETKELIAGFWLWRVNSMQEAINWVKRCPNPMPEDSIVEIRQVYEADDLGEAFTPELREQEAITFAKALGLPTPSFQDCSRLLVAGLAESYSKDTHSKIPQQWERLCAYLKRIPCQVGGESYGVCWNADPSCNFEYLAGVAVSSADNLPADLKVLEIAARRYAVFPHPGHVSTIASTIETIWSKWAPDCGLRLSHSAPCFERYTSAFDPSTGLGGMELWLPLETTPASQAESRAAVA